MLFSWEDGQSFMGLFSLLGREGRGPSKDFSYYILFLPPMRPKIFLLLVLLCTGNMGTQATTSEEPSLYYVWQYPQGVSPKATIFVLHKKIKQKDCGDVEKSLLYGFLKEDKNVNPKKHLWIVTSYNTGEVRVRYHVDNFDEEDLLSAQQVAGYIKKHTIEPEGLWTLAGIDGKNLHDSIQKGLPGDIESLIKKDKNVPLPIPDKELIRPPNEEGDASSQTRGSWRVVLGALMAFSMVCLGMVGYRGRAASLKRITRQRQGR